MYSFSYAAQLLGVDRRTISDLVRLNEIPVYRHPSNGLAKAIDSRGLTLIEKSLERAILSDKDKSRSVPK